MGSYVLYEPWKTLKASHPVMIQRMIEYRQLSVFNPNTERVSALGHKTITRGEATLCNTSNDNENSSATRGIDESKPPDVQGNKNITVPLFPKPPHNVPVTIACAY